MVTEQKIEVLALIPARGGSKSIPRKNILSFAGHPLISFSIAAAQQARTVTRLIVSTDDEEIAEVSREYGAEVPFLRPAEFSQDDTPDLPVFRHALDWLGEHESYRPEIVVHLRPTTPVRPPDCIDQAVGILLENPAADSVRGVVPAGQNPFKMWRIEKGGRMLPLLSLDSVPEPYNAPRQTLPQTYWQTGHIDAIRVTAIYQKDSLSGDVVYPLLLDARYTVDIDTLDDWRRAEWLVEQGDLEMVRPGPQRRPLPDPIELVVFDFDGVMTDNRAWVDRDGREQVAVNRSDGLGIARLRQAGVEMVVLSTETNPVVLARCRKLGLPVLQSLQDKGPALLAMLEERRIDPKQVVYLGNDVNDLVCFPLVGCSVVVADAHPEASAQADLVLKNKGGYGAVREFCDILLQQIMKRSNQ